MCFHVLNFRPKYIHGHYFCHHLIILSYFLDLDLKSFHRHPRPPRKRKRISNTTNKNDQSSLPDSVQLEMAHLWTKFSFKVDNNSLQKNHVITVSCKPSEFTNLKRNSKLNRSKFSIYSPGGFIKVRIF